MTPPSATHLACRGTASPPRAGHRAQQPAPAHDSGQPGRLEGKTALVTGAGRGIGRATAERFAEEGARVVATGRSQPANWQHANPQLTWVNADVTDRQAMAHALRHAQDTGGVDVCVANAGIMLLEDFLDSDPESWEAVIRINLLGVMTTLQLAAAQMAKRARGGRLLATTSVAGIRGDAGSAAYSASKAGVIAVTQTLAAELAPLHITVNAVAPGEIDTPMHADTMRRLAEANKTTPQALRRDLLNRRVPARRMGSAVEVAALFAYLASDDAAYITGETIRIDGGWWLV